MFPASSLNISDLSSKGRLPHPAVSSVCGWVFSSVKVEVKSQFVSFDCFLGVVCGLRGPFYFFLGERMFVLKTTSHVAGRAT